MDFGFLPLPSKPVWLKNPYLNKVVQKLRLSTISICIKTSSFGKIQFVFDMDNSL
jgi:hypothetical protein